MIKPILNRWTPRSLTNLRLWLNADDRSAFLDGSGNPITNGANVEHWYCSQFNYDFNAQSTVSKRPIWNSTGFGTKSKPYVEFDGTSDILRCINTSLLSSLSGDSVGTIIIVGANMNAAYSPSISHYVSSYTEASPTNGLNLGSRAVSSTFRAGTTPWTAGSNRDIYSGQYPVNLSKEVIYLMTSNGSAYDFRVLYQDVSSITVNVGPNDGNWFADITPTSNVCISSAKTTSEFYYKLRVAEVIITGTNIVDGSNEQIYLEQYIRQKYGTLNGE